MASLDVMNGMMVMEMLRRIASETGLTVIATLHHVEYARKYADRVLGLRAGRLVFDGPAGDLTDTAISGIFGQASRGGSGLEAPRLATPEWVTG